MEFRTYPTGWLIEDDLPKQVAVSTGSTVHATGAYSDGGLTTSKYVYSIPLW